MTIVKIQNSYLCHVTKLMTLPGSFQKSGKRKMSFHAFGQCFQLFIDEALQNSENMLKSYL